MFISPRELFKQAEEKKAAIGAFNTSNLEVTQAIVSAAEDVGVPAIIQTTAKAIAYAGLNELFAIVKTAIDETTVPITIHLDHCTDIELIKKCLDIGYRSVMFDGSRLSFEENVAATKKVVDLAHHFGAFVEGEIGIIARGEEGEKSTEHYTDPGEAKDFVRLTGVNTLAVSVGNIHGAPTGEKLDINLLKSINRVVDLPLVLHGGSGLTRSDIREAIGFGVRKINIDTQLKKAFKKSLQQNVDDPSKDLREFLSDAKESVELVVIKYLKIFNNIE